MNAGATQGMLRWLLAVLSGGLLALSFPGSGDQAWLAFVALVPLLAAVEGDGWRRAGARGLVAGLAFWLLTIPWIASTVARYGDVPWPLSVLVLAGLAGYLALYTAAFAALLARRSLPGGGLYVIVAASLWVALELLRTYLFTGFPWNLLGYSQYRNLPLIQVAAATGVYGVSFLVVAVNAALWRALDRESAWRRSLAAFGTAAAIVGAAIAFGWLSPHRAGGSPIPVAVAQGSVDQAVKWDATHQGVTLSLYRDLTVQAAGRGARLVVWPETAVPFFLAEDPRRAEVEGLARATGAYLLVGAPDRSSGKPRNSAFLIGPDGRVLGRYDKRHLVPFGEYVPVKRLLFFVEILGGGAIGDFAPGSEATVFATPAGRIGVVICYEAIFPGEVRDFFRAGADVLVNITNDAWFGRSAAPVQHLAMAAFRAVENRAYLVRAANTGISAIVRPDGRIERASGLFTREVLTGVVARHAGLTLYARYGDVFAGASAVVALTMLWPVSLRRTNMRWFDRRSRLLTVAGGRTTSRRRVVGSALAGAAAVAATVSGLRPRLADGRGYQDIARWRIPGGEGWFIVVDGEPTLDDLRALGGQLRERFASVENAIVMVFDDPEAAREVRRGSRTIGETQFEAALRHQRAMYVKQSARGEHRFIVFEPYPTPREVIRY